jgi:hypothetical protein
MQETFKVTCPCCNSILVIGRRDGAIIEVREPIVKESSGDRFQDAVKRVKGRVEEVDAKLQEAKRLEEERKKGADDFFKEALKRAKESGDTKPYNPLDME